MTRLHGEIGQNLTALNEIPVTDKAAALSVIYEIVEAMQYATVKGGHYCAKHVFRVVVRF